MLHYYYYIYKRIDIQFDMIFAVPYTPHHPRLAWKLYGMVLGREIRQFACVHVSVP
jgi:hypothetical protein